MNSLNTVSTGCHGLDQVLDYLRIGDNVVWQVDAIEDYLEFVKFLIKKARSDGRRIVYMRFARHQILIASKDVKTYKIDAYSGFEKFSTQIHEIAKKEGEGVFYIFDCLSDLLFAWATDLMIGNFFRVTCPYLFQLNTVAYFALLRNRNSFKTIAHIREITQVLLDVYENEGHIYIHPIKVWNRYSPTMFLPHVLQGDKFVPIFNSSDAALFFSKMEPKEISHTKRNMDYWENLFIEAEDLQARIKQKDSLALSKRKKMIKKLCQLIMGRDARVLSLTEQYFSLQDFLNIKSRLIGSGHIGGKSVGMLLARKILDHDQKTKWEEYLELHDSFYVGSDVFYTYLVQNDLWDLRMEQRLKENYFSKAYDLQNKLLNGSFQEEIKEQFLRMLEYFGQSPIIVRSSSLLEDSFGNAFAGKYESVFCVNQGSLEKRYHDFEKALRLIYASTMNKDALTYRLQRGLDQQEEQMALLVQRVSGSHHKNYFFPDAAGVGVSYNTYVWKNNMDPKAGMIRVVFGLGTRAVNRVEGDYARIVALDAPHVQPYADEGEAKKYSQHDVDVLNIKKNEFQSCSIYDLGQEDIDFNMEYIGQRDYEAEHRLAEMGRERREVWIVQFKKLLLETTFPGVIAKMLKSLEQSYDYPVEIEFTLNFKDSDYRINLLQCRPLQTKGLKAKVKIPPFIPKDKIFIKSVGNFMGGNTDKVMTHVIYVSPKEYSDLKHTDKYQIARLVGRLNRRINKISSPTLLLGPGRWGTTTPSLGIPVSFSEINNMAALGEMAYMRAGLVPEVSFGTHFFQDLVETDIFYMALFPDKKDVLFHTKWMDQLPNVLEDWLSEQSSFRDVIKVYDLDSSKYKKLRICSDIVTQDLVCYFPD
ncbi:MAG: PEP/pyruvate-binding domain-containing protein [Spirochaetes bacterium]|nr:PEP/pyruvate-binding domain-containing protein [Spirochaetota bacterium]